MLGPMDPWALGFALAAIVAVVALVAARRATRRATVAERDAADRTAAMKLAGEERRQSRDTLADSLDQGLLDVGSNLHVLRANPVAHALTGRAEGDLVGRSLIEVFLDPAAEAVANEAIVDGDAVGEISIADVDGPTISIRATRGAGGGVTMLLTDVSELRRLQRIRTEFIDNLSHELRTPLTTVSLLAETLTRDADASGEALPPRMRDRIGKIEVETGHLVQMVSELLDLSRIESGGRWAARGRRSRRAAVERSSACGCSPTARASTLRVDVPSRPAGSRRPGAARTGRSSTSSTMRSSSARTAARSRPRPRVGGDGHGLGRGPWGRHPEGPTRRASSSASTRPIRPRPAGRRDRSGPGDRPARRRGSTTAASGWSPRRVWGRRSRSTCPIPVPDPRLSPMDRLHVATLNILNLADRWDERLPLLLADFAALQPDLMGLQEVVYVDAAGPPDRGRRGGAVPGDPGLGRPARSMATPARPRPARADRGAARPRPQPGRSPGHVALPGGAAVLFAVTHLHHLGPAEAARDGQARP